MWFRDETTLGEVNHGELLEKLRSVFKLIPISLISNVSVVSINLKKQFKMQDMLLGVYPSTGFALRSYVLLTMHCQIMQVCHNLFNII